MVNSGESEQHSTWRLRNIGPKALDHDLDLTLVEFSCDETVNRFTSTTDQATASLAEMIRRLPVKNGDTAVVLQTMNVSYDVPHG